MGRKLTAVSDCLPPFPLPSPDALFAETKRWLDGGADVPSGEFGQGDASFVTSLTLKPQVLKQGPENRLLRNMESKFEPSVVSDGADSHAFVLKWKGGGGSSEAGKAVFPEYYKVDGDTMVPVDAADVPDETELKSQEFLQYDFRAAYDEAPGYVDTAAATAGTCVLRKGPLLMKSKPTGFVCIVNPNAPGDVGQQSNADWVMDETDRP